MPGSRLDLSSLRRLPFQETPPGCAVDALTGRTYPTDLSRRGFFALGSVGALAASSLGRGAHSAWLGPYRLEASERRLAVSLEGRERWVVACSRYAGAPRLRVERTEEGWHVTLSGARYPGTDLPAGFDCLIARTPLGSRMTIRLELGDLEATVPFERWLLGLQPARGAVALGNHRCDVGGAHLDLHGSGEGRYWPTGGLELEGERIASLGYEGAECPSSRLHLLPLERTASSLLRDPSPARTLISLERGDARWPLRAPGPADVGALEGAFDVLRLEAGESGASALLAEGRNGATVAYTPEGVVDSDGRSLRIPLRQPRLAAELGAGGGYAALVARMASESTWVQTGGMSLRVGDRSDLPAFETACGSDGRGSVRFAPALLAWHAPLEGAVSAVAHAPEGASVVLASAPQSAGAGTQRSVEGARQPVKPADPGDRRLVRPDVQVDRERRIPSLDLGDWTVDVVRPEDFLCLRFEFRNLSLNATAKPAVLKRLKPGEQAWILVHFPPQHIGEEAFFEADPNYQIPPPAPGKPADPDYGKGTLNPTALPVQSRLAGPSRLCFRVPTSVASIPYTIAGLLDWSKLEPSISPSAPPPPVPAQVTAGSMATIDPSDIHLGNVSTPGTRVRAPSVLSARKAVEATLAPADMTALDVAFVQPRNPLDPPLDTETALELPYRLILSPNRLAGWAHASEPTVKEGWTELWHTRLGVRGANGHVHDGQWEYAPSPQGLRVVREATGGLVCDRLRTLRAIWSPDAGPGSGRFPDDATSPFRMSLSPRDRHELVWLTTRLADSATRVVRANRLMLSSLGAWLDSRYAAEPPDGMTLEEWRHQATMGRDQYVRVVYKGYLFPFGHRASLVKVTERKFQPTPDGSGTMAVLRQRMFIIVRQPERYYGQTGYLDQGRAVDREMPFVRVRINTRVTPNLDPPAAYTGSMPAMDAFCPGVGSTDFLFHLTAEDLLGNTSEFSAPLVFVSNLVRDKASNMGAVRTTYDTQPERTARPWSGQKVTLAEPVEATSEDTTLRASLVTFSAYVPPQASPLSPDAPRFLPIVASADVDIPAVSQLTGKTAGTTIRYNETYLKEGFTATANKGGMFADVAEEATSPGFGFPAEMVGSMAAPSLGISGLSRTYGPTGGAPADLVGGTFAPEKFLSEGAQLFGCIPLSGIIAGVFGGEKVPGITTTVKRDAQGMPTSIESRFDWLPDVQKCEPFFKLRGGASLEMRGEMTTPIAPTGAPGKATYSLRTTLRNFSIDLYTFIIADFDSLEFIARSEHKPDTIVKIADVKFGGPIAFLNPLRDYLGGSAFTDGPGLDVSPSGVKLSYSIAIPDIAVGAFSLQNLKLSGALAIPFDGTPLNFRFAFCERSDPFLLTVSLFGGGGFFALTLYPKKELIKIEGSLEFGACVALNLGVASGSAYVMAGIYFAWQNSKAALTGYVRAGGSLSVLGLITISVEFYLSLTYDDGRVWGQASLTVEVEVLFFSTSVTLTVEREFAGGGGSAMLDREIELAALPSAMNALLAPAPVSAGAVSMRRPPTIKETLAVGDWQAYCAAFA